MKRVTKKIDTEWLEMILADKKKFELRLADFEIEEGDILRLEEWVGEGENRKLTGRSVEKKINNVQKIDLEKWLKRQPELAKDGFYVLQFD